MGCVSSSTTRDGHRRIRKPKRWRHTEAITVDQLTRMREEFWDTQPYYGGNREIWDALKAAAEADVKMAQLIVDTAGIIAHHSDLTVCYDERGGRYELPLYVLSEPSNLIRNTASTSTSTSTPPSTSTSTPPTTSTNQ